MDLKQIIVFLTQLQENNNKEWFDANRNTYEKAREEWIKFATESITAVGDFDKDIALLEPKKCIFRINRDVRFSKNKDPYKNNFGLSLNKGGKREDFCGYYLHLQPGASFIAGGAYAPMPDKLAAIRQEIDYNAKEFLEIVNDKNFKKHFGTLGGETLQRPPKGYEADNPMVDFLKHKSFIGQYTLTDKELFAPDFMKNLVEKFKALQPLIAFLNRAIKG